MKAHSIRPAVNAMTLDVDRCARSGLKMPCIFSTIYTPDLDNIRPFYADLLGIEHIKFETDDMIVYELPSGHSVLLQKVNDESPFAALKGNQSFGFGVTNQNKDLAEPVLDWKDAHQLVADPDGNKILLASADAEILKSRRAATLLKAAS